MKAAYLFRPVSWVFLLLSLSIRPVLAQGQDSTIVERDRQVIATLLPGVWNNNNQSYFDRRLRVPQADAHGRLHARITHDESDAARLALQLWWGRETEPAASWLLDLADGENAVEMTVRKRSEPRRSAGCTVIWRREAAQFRGTAVGEAGCTDLPSVWILSEQQLWIAPLVAPESTVTQTAYKLHRTRAFKCYVDMPGVGGGRDEPYERYGEFDTHDGGGLIRFRPKDEPDREIGVSLWRVDWPINNYEGVFTRDVLVLSVLEFMPDGSFKDHGYTFTEPDVERIGINLKWLLANCYVQSHADQTPFM